MYRNGKLLINKNFTLEVYKRARAKNFYTVSITPEGEQQVKKIPYKELKTLLKEEKDIYFKKVLHALILVKFTDICYAKYTSGVLNCNISKKEKEELYKVHLHSGLGDNPTYGGPFLRLHRARMDLKKMERKTLEYYHPFKPTRKIFYKFTELGNILFLNKINNEIKYTLTFNSIP